MARPLVEAVAATGRVASGDLESRVPIRSGDYPEFRSLAGSINDMAQSLEDGRARERQLLLAVSHDLRTPLTSIRGFAEAIKDGAIE
ncbi:MAG TPA: HAMP domain-containing protein, partial [Acidimicrobiales bacterium]